MANHLTPDELADEMQMKRSEVIETCVRMGIPIFQGRIDKTLFHSSVEVEESGQVIHEEASAA